MENDLVLQHNTIFFPSPTLTTNHQNYYSKHLKLTIYKIDNDIYVLHLSCH